eukprot:5935680-Amphidinium_carterae.1
MADTKGLPSLEVACATIVQIALSLLQGVYILSLLTHNSQHSLLCRSCALQPAKTSATRQRRATHSAEPTLKYLSQEEVMCDALQNLKGHGKLVFVAVVALRLLLLRLS